jgi:hypothetical protein
MPQQSGTPTTPEWAVGNTAPNLRNCLVDGDGIPIDLTGATVVINIAFASWSFYYAPQRRLVTDGVCVVDPDQTETGNRGFVDWTPLTTDLSLAGTYRYTYDITYQSGGVQTISPNAENSLTVRPPVGGMQYA